MTESYVTQLISLYETQVKKLIEEQNPVIANALGMASMHIGSLKQARDRCDFENQLYYVNRISRILGEIEGNAEAKKETACSDLG